MGTHVRLQVKSRESVMITERMLTVTTWKCYPCISPEVFGEQPSHQDEMLANVNISGKTTDMFTLVLIRTYVPFVSMPPLDNFLRRPCHNSQLCLWQQESDVF